MESLNDRGPAIPEAPRIDGWDARYIGSEPRLSEVADMYRELGFMVRIEPFYAGGCDTCCQPCFENPLTPVKVVYVKEIG